MVDEMRTPLQYLPKLLLSFWIIWLVHPYLRLLPGTDAGLFSAVAMEMLHGQQLYAQVFESKPPLVFLLNALSLSTGFGYHAIRITELFILLGLGHLYLNRLSTYFKQSAPAFLSAVLLFGLLLKPELYSKGNQTEFYASFCLITGWALLLSPKDHRSHIELLIAGISFSFAIWFREFFAPASLLSLLYFSLRSKNAARSLLWVGFAIPFILFAIWMSLSAGWPSYLQYLQYQMNYGQYATNSVTNGANHLGWTLRMYRELLFDRHWWPLLLCMLLMVTGFLPHWNRKHQFLPALASVLSLLQFFILSRSGYHFGHYYYLALWPMILMIIPWLKFAAEKHHLPKWLMWLAALICVFMLKPWRPATDILKGGLKGYAADNITLYLQQNKSATDRLCVLKTDAGHYYADTDMHSALMFPVPVFHYFSIPMAGHSPEHTASQQLQMLKKSPPTFIISGGKPGLFLQRSEGLEWFHQNYNLILNNNNGNFLYQLQKD